MFLNLHNTETNEYLETQASDAASRRRINRLFEQLVASTSFDPAGSMPLQRSGLTTPQTRFTASGGFRSC